MFELPNLLADRTLRDMQVLCSLGKAVVFHDGIKKQQRFERE